MSRILTTILILLAAPIAAAAGDEDTSYGYLRTVEGPGRIVQAGSGSGVAIEANYPVLAGDLLEVDPGGRVELSLPDFNVVRLAGGSELVLARLALSAETDDRETVLQLRRGELQFLVNDLLPVDERPRVDTANATVYLLGSGVYRIASDGYGWTEVVVRQGFAEVATEAGSSVVRSGEQAWIEGERYPRVGIDRAGASDELERWGARLDGQPASYAAAEVDSHLSYAAAPLHSYGSWVWVDGYRAWRPRVAHSWRPYEVGYWRDTPLGLVWVSHEPWAWVTYHYGSWVPTPVYGWVWRPGRRFAPAWVYWYWGPRWVGWVPVGYYSHYYRHHGWGFRFGIHGWAGGSWAHFADWTFCSRGSYRRRDLHHHIHRGSRLARDTRSLAIERGLVATDSRREARERAVTRLPGRGTGDDLPDVTAFVARRKELPREVQERVFTARKPAERIGGERRAVGRDELWEGPKRAAPASPRARVPGGVTRERTVLPGEAARERAEAWRRESGRVRSVPGADERARPRAVSPGERDTTRRPWWQDRGDRALPPGPAARDRVPPTGPTARDRMTSPRGPGAGERSSVTRRVWERIRGRQEAPPPTADRPSAPPSRGPSAAPRREPPRGSSDARRSPPPRPSSSARPSSAPRRSPSTSAQRSGPSRSSARSRGSSSRSSDGRSSGGRARRGSGGG